MQDKMNQLDGFALGLSPACAVCGAEKVVKERKGRWYCEEHEKHAEKEQRD